MIDNHLSILCVEGLRADDAWFKRSASWRKGAEQFNLEDAAAAEAAVGAVQRARQSAGLVSVSTTHTRAKTPLSQALKKSPALQAPHVARAAAAGVYMPTADEDSARVRQLRRAVGFSARAQVAHQRAASTDEVLMLTLTYADASGWRPNHMSKLMNCLRMWFSRQGLAFRYTWVAELQKRGAIHYHVALWVPRGVRVPMPDKRGWWPHGMTNIEKARHASKYLMKYLSKGGDKNGCWRLPQGARMYGVGGLDHLLRRARRWLSYPDFVKARADILDDWKRAEGGGWRDPEGNVWQSEFQPVKVGPYAGFERVCDHGRPFQAGAPFTWLHRGPGRAGEGV
jgi:hypothetical protein